MKEAVLWKAEGGKIRCFLCSHRCLIAEGNTGICAVRQNEKGVLYSLVYGKVIAAHVDPIEKKPFYHFLPGSLAYSIATVGCNFRCKNCQNSDISQAPREKRGIIGQDIEPTEIVSNALEADCRTIAYTYTEPTIFFEYAFDVSKLAKKRRIYNAYVSNGFMTEEMLDYSKGFIDAANVDLKAFSDKFYREMCGARLEPVLSTLRKMRKLGIWVEITTLLIPGYNDSKEELEQIAQFIKEDVGKETPWHISRFHPDYKLTDIGQTPAESVKKARDIGINAGLKYVYTGNLPGDKGENTYCPKCKTALIERNGYIISKNRIKDKKCPECDEKIDGIWI